MRIRIDLKGTSPLLMHNPRMVDPEFELCRQLKAITSKRKKTDEDLAQIAKLEWYGGLFEDNGVPMQPTSKVRKCICNAAKITKQGTTMQRALVLDSLFTELIHDGPKNIHEMFEDLRFHSRLSVVVNKARVMRVRPMFMPWALSVTGILIPDAGLNYDSFVQIVEMAGIAEGIGDNRVNGYGRFVGKVVKG